MAASENRHPAAANGATAALLLALAGVSAVKGLNLIVPPSASYLYYTDYRFGFILRGLLGQLFTPALAVLGPQGQLNLMLAWHFALLGLFLVVLTRFAARTVGRTGRVLAILLVCSPLIPSLAQFTAAPDILLCLLTLGVVVALRAERLWLAWAIFLVGVLVHQLMIFLALPLMLLASLLCTSRPLPAAAGSLAVGLLACVLVLMAPVPDPHFVARFIEQGIRADVAPDLYTNQLAQTSGRMLGFMAELWRQHTRNGLIAVAYGATASLVILAASLFQPGALQAAGERLPVPRRLGRVLIGLLALGAGLSPLLVLAFAWDLSRLAVLSIFTAFLVADMLLRTLPPREPSPAPRPAALACGALAVGFLVLPFMGLWFTGGHVNRQELIVPNPVLEIGATRRAVDAFLAFYNRTPTGSGGS